MIIKPAPGCRVLDPDNFYRPIPPEGAIVGDSTHWQRRLADGDIEIVTEEVPAAESVDEVVTTDTSKSSRKAKGE